MEAVLRGLQETYLEPLKEETPLYVGIELEFPIVNRSGGPTDVSVSKALMTYLANSGGGLVVEQKDEDGQAVELHDPVTDDRILFEVSYTILEMAFGKAKSIPEVEVRYQKYLTLIQNFLGQHNHALEGCGIHPAWEQNDHSPVTLPRYQMLMAYLALAEHLPEATCHPFHAYGAFICGNQVQLDVTRSNYLRVLNAFNQIEAAKAYLFANSRFSGADWDTTIARDRFWEESMHGLIPANVGVYPNTFKTEQDFLTYLTQTAMFTVQREGNTYYFPPRPLATYLTETNLEVYALDQSRQTLTPQLSDLSTHRPYHYQALTKRGTVEFRSVCTQPLDRTFAPTAFHLGLLENLAELETYLSQADFFVAYGRDYPALRRQFSKTQLTQEEKHAVQTFARDLLKLAKKGLEKRGYGEENYLLRRHHEKN